VDDVQEPNTEVALGAAREVDPEAQLGDMVTVESTPRNFGRIAAQAAKQVILQRIREAERESQYQEYVQREGDIVNGTVQSVSAQGVTLGLGRTEATLPRNQMVPGERYHAHEKVRAYVLEVRKTTRGPQIIVSRSHKNMLRRLLEYEVPEIYNGAVEIKSIAREPGQRSKVAVAALQEGVDPVGACVGMRGVRIQSIVRELNDEKIDVIEWNPDQAVFIAKALSPARVTSVYLDDDPLAGRTAMVVVPDDQLSLAIGREGQNARLAAKLTGWRIDIKSLTEAATDAYRKLRDLPAFAETAAAHPEITGPAETILAKKAEGKPIPPEEYQLLAKMVETVEKRVARGRQEERAAKVEKVAAIKATIPEPAYQVLLADAKLPERVLRALLDADFKNVGQVMEQLALDDDRILGLEGFGPKMLDELKTAMAAVTLPEPPAAPAEAPVSVELAAEEAAPAAATAEAAVQPEAGLAEPTAAPTASLEAAPGERAAALAAAADQAATVAESAAPAGEAAAVLAAAEGAPAAEGVAETTEAEGEEGATGTAEEEGEEEPADKDSEDGDDKKKGKKKSKKKGAVEITYDEDLGMFITRKKRKPGRAKDDVFGLSNE
jgi:N utilization substance protein A